MPKNIIFCADGTWNHPQEPKPKDGQGKLNTNVAKLADHKLPDGTDEAGSLASSPTQVVLYDDGLGVEFPEVLGGAFGVGIYGKVKQGYAQIAAVYEKGDRIFLFGFSRGAYTARCLASVLSFCGIPTTMAQGRALLFRDVGSTRKIAKEAVKKVYAYVGSPKDTAIWSSVGRWRFNFARSMGRM